MITKISARDVRNSIGFGHGSDAILKGPIDSYAVTLLADDNIGMEHGSFFLEHIPRLREKFIHPVKIERGVYLTPQEPSTGCDLKLTQF